LIFGELRFKVELCKNWFLVVVSTYMLGNLPVDHLEQSTCQTTGGRGVRIPSNAHRVMWENPKILNGAKVGGTGDVHLNMQDWQVRKEL